MKQIILIFAIIAILISCKKETDFNERNKFLVDSLKIVKLSEERTDSVIQDATKTKILDTTGMKDCPVKITKSQLVKEEYTNYKNISLKYKNVSKKTIQGIRFEWYGENSFNEPAEMGNSIAPGYGGGFSEDIIKPNQSNSGTWKIYSIDAKKIITARAYEVAFTDGTSWKLKQD